MAVGALLLYSVACHKQRFESVIGSCKRSLCVQAAQILSYIERKLSGHCVGDCSAKSYMQLEVCTAYIAV